jgi:hypothetical protein
MTAEPVIAGREHWTSKGDVRLFLWEKRAGTTEGRLGTLLFVHGSSMASQPTFDLQVPGRQDSSAMDLFARLGYDTWCVDMEGYGLLGFFASLPNPDKQFAVMPGIAHASLQQKNYRIVHHILHGFFSQPAPVYRGA